MSSKLTKIPLNALVVGAMIATLACMGGASVPPTPEPTPVEVTAKADMNAQESTPVPSATSRPTSTPAPTPAPADTQAPEPTPSPTAIPFEYDSDVAMYDIFPGFTVSMTKTNEALEQIRANRDTSMIPVLVEILRFMPSQSSRDRVANTLESLTGQQYAGNDWDKWMDWMGENLDGIEPPEGYPDWKAGLYSVIDERFAYFLRPARDFSRINLEEVVWGGVRPDGIPDLRRPTFLESDEATYMNDDDRVFGLEINGDVRAYPLRVVNAHEMVNDSVGGEPISLMW